MRFIKYITLIFLLFLLNNLSFSTPGDISVFSKILYMIKDDIIKKDQPVNLQIYFNEHGEEIYQVDTIEIKKKTFGKDYIAPAIIFVDTFGVSCEFIDTLNGIACVRSLNSNINKFFTKVKVCYISGIGTGRYNSLAIAVTQDKPTNPHSVYYFDILGKNVTIRKRW